MREECPSLNSAVAMKNHGKAIRSSVGRITTTPYAPSGWGSSRRRRSRSSSTLRGNALKKPGGTPGYAHRRSRATPPSKTNIGSDFLFIGFNLRNLISQRARPRIPYGLRPASESGDIRSSGKSCILAMSCRVSTDGDAPVTDAGRPGIPSGPSSQITSSTEISSNGIIDILILARSMLDPSAFTLTFALQSVTHCADIWFFMRKLAVSRQRPVRPHIARACCSHLRRIRDRQGSSSYPD